MTLEDTIKEEHNIIYSYIDNGRPFEYLDKLKKDYGVTNDINKLVDYSLDVFNHYQRNGVFHDTVFYSLAVVANSVFVEYYKRKEK